MGMMVKFRTKLEINEKKKGKVIRETIHVFFMDNFSFVCWYMHLLALFAWTYFAHDMSYIVIMISKVLENPTSNCKYDFEFFI